MAIKRYKKISELDAITSASLSTYVAGVDNGQTVRITLNVLADGVRNTINTLDVQRLNALEIATASLNAATSSYEKKGNGIVSSSTQITAFGFISSSQTVDTGSFVTTSSFESFSSSVHTEILAATNEQNLSYLVMTSSFNEYTASISTGSLVNRLSSLENNTGSYLTSLNGTISSSAQITAFGFISESVDISALNSFTQSQSALNTAFTNGINSRLQTSSFNEFSTSVDSRILAATNEQFLGGFATTSSLNNLSTSVDIRLDILEAYSSSQIVPTASYSERTTQVDVLVKNVSGAQIDKGKVVRISGATGDNPLIVTASFLTEGQSANTLGITTQNIPNDSFGYVITEGVLLGLNTTGMNAGELLYLGSNGSFTTTPPTAPNHGVRLGEVLRQQQNNGSIYVRIDNGSELGEAHDVVDTSTTSSYGDILMKSGSVWINNTTFSSSISTFSASFDSRITALTFAVPVGTISGSAQITAFGFVSGSYETTGRGIISSSAQLPSGLISGSSQLTSSLDTRYAASGSAPTLFLLEAYANVTYTLPGTFTEDPCRYSIVSVNENVPSSWFDTSTYTFTPQKAGYWEIVASYDVYRNSEASMAIKKNGSIVASAGSFNAVAQQIKKIIYLNGSTDYINIINVGGSAQLRAQFQSRSWFQARWIGE